MGLDPIVGFLIFIILFGAFVLFFMILYKSREDIGKWLGQRPAPSDYSERKLQLARELEDSQRIAARKQEDIERKLERITEREKRISDDTGKEPIE